MPWLSIIMALVTFFLAGGSDKEKRGKAALAAVAVGAGTYAVTNHTNWGRETLGSLDGVDLTVDAAGNPAVVSGPGQPAVAIPSPGTIAATQGQNASANGFWSTLSGWLSSPAGQITSGATVGKAAGIPNWMLLAGAGLAIFLLAK